jgi:membrane associated rhomboid family serine protease
MCRSCGAIIGAGQTTCAVCDAPLVTRTDRSKRPPAVYDRETLRFARAVLGRPYIFTIIFLIANFFLFLLMWHSSGMSFRVLAADFPIEVLVAYGAKLNSRINQQHEWWRFVTPMFLHVNLLHILVNMYSLWMVGPYVEKLYGSARFVFFWVATGIAGVLASYLTVVRPGSPLGGFRFLFKTTDGPSAGASGAIFGLVGVLFVFGIKFRKELPEGFKRAFGTGLLPVIVINLFIGYLGSGVIDNAAHLGGLLSGAGLALVVSYRRPGEGTRMALAWQAVRVIALALVLISFAKVAQHFSAQGLVNQADDQPQVGPADQNTSSLLFLKTMSEGQEIFQNAIHGDSKEVDGVIAKLEGSRPPDSKADQLRKQLVLLLKDAKQFVAQPPTPTPTPVPSKPKDAPDAQSKLKQDFKTWKAEYDQWLKTKT